VPGDDRKPPRATTHSGAGRDRRHRDSAGAPITPIWDEVTGQYDDPEELARARRARAEASPEVAIAILEHKVDNFGADFKTQKKLVDDHNATIQLVVKPLLAKLPEQLTEISVTLAKLAGDVDGVANRMRDHVASITHQLQDHHQRIEAGKAAQDADRARVAAVEQQARDTALDVARHTKQIEKLKAARSSEAVDVKVGSWVRRHASKAVLVIAAAIASAIAGGVSGYLFGQKEPPPALKGTP
jgi:hypothetical protein